MGSAAFFVAFAAWWTLLHASIMAIQTVEAFSYGIHRDYKDIVIATIIGAILLRITAKREAAAALLSLES